MPSHMGCVIIAWPPDKVLLPCVSEAQKDLMQLTNHCLHAMCSPMILAEPM